MLFRRLKRAFLVLTGLVSGCFKLREVVSFLQIVERGAMKPRTANNEGIPGGGRYSLEIWAGVRGPLLETLTLFQTKI